MQYIVLLVAGCTLTDHKPTEEARKLNICNVNGITAGYICK
jgi:hypothetical protein